MSATSSQSSKLGGLWRVAQVITWMLLVACRPLADMRLSGLSSTVAWSLQA